jgi:hypothetical protein
LALMAVFISSMIWAAKLIVLSIIGYTICGGEDKKNNPKNAVIFRVILFRVAQLVYVIVQKGIIRSQLHIVITVYPQRCS